MAIIYWFEKNKNKIIFLIFFSSKYIYIGRRILLTSRCEIREHKLNYNAAFENSFYIIIIIYIVIVIFT